MVDVKQKKSKQYVVVAVIVGRIGHRVGDSPELFLLVIEIMRKTTKHKEDESHQADLKHENVRISSDCTNVFRICLMWQQYSKYRSNMLKYAKYDQIDLKSSLQVYY